ncbi:hypothetical protein PPYR_09038, partial [Photinus pyralis]
EKMMEAGSKSTRVFEQSASVMARKFGGGEGSRWQPEKIVRQLGPVTYETVDEIGKTQKRHVDHLRRNVMNGPSETDEIITDNLRTDDNRLQEEEPVETALGDTKENMTVTTGMQRPQRNAGMPSRFRDFVVSTR